MYRYLIIMENEGGELDRRSAGARALKAMSRRAMAKGAQ